MASFPDFVNENEIAKSWFIGELLTPSAPFDQKSGRETWTVSFAPDGSYFAWSQGHRIVRIVPWSQCLNNFTLDGNVSNNVEDRRLSTQNSDGQQQKNIPREHTIDCGDIVWGLAFGSSVPEKQSRCANIEWHRFKFGQDQLLLATGLNNGRIKIWDVYTGKLLLNLMDHTEVVRDLTFAPDGSLILVSASRDKTLRVWDLKDDGNMIKVLRGHQSWVYCSAFSPDSSVLCSVGAGKAVFLWDMDAYTMIRKLEGHHNDVVSCEFSPDGALLATASYDTRVLVWDPCTGSVLLEFGHLFPPPTLIFAGGENDRWVRSVSFCHDGQSIASVADDRMVRFWNIEQKSPQAIAPLSNGLCCAFSIDGRTLAAGTRDGSVYFWATPRIISSLQHLCRMAIRRVMSTDEVKKLPVPDRVVDFLSYRIM
ncbi:WD repeat and SOCS box-containing protein 1 [Polyodon spathula]|uniref:WD repeat and SOCS box-containing protein 1 n=1 Tax=Polyodon spathula TaxID=7913 RepID=UPI001B7F0070|nr:WD repeat and SOCS box-containing protein 1 [Polyodon spathula]